MQITHVRANNWRNFKSLDFPVENRLFIVGPNAAGKSNLLDIFKFLGDIAAPGGGLASALARRGGLSAVRSLFARNFKKGRLEIDLDLQDGDDRWRYFLSIKGEKGGFNRPIVEAERVERNGEVVLNRPDQHDEADPELMTQTHLEQISANREFRNVADYFAQVRFFHPVPQIIREPFRIPGIAEDPFGSDFVAHLNDETETTKRAWLRRMQSALQAAVPGFETLEMEVDSAGKPHLVAGYRNWRTKPTRQTEADFSDGTLRLIGLLWFLISSPAKSGVLLLEEPELSLNSAIVRTLPTVFAIAQRDRTMQVMLSTHAPEILDDEGVSPDEVLVLKVTEDGTTATLLSQIDTVKGDLEAELPTSEIVEALVSPEDLSGLVAVGRSR